jgi:hypothetical protein
MAPFTSSRAWNNVPPRSSPRDVVFLPSPTCVYRYINTQYPIHYIPIFIFPYHQQHLPFFFLSRFPPPNFSNREFNQHKECSFNVSLLSSSLYAQQLHPTLGNLPCWTTTTTFVASITRHHCPGTLSWRRARGNGPGTAFGSTVYVSPPPA